MAFYNGIECPVCGKAFVQGDDIVTCPVCGTPSHRSCYDSLGHCPNGDKHSQGFSFDLKAVRAEIEAEEETAVPQNVPAAVQKQSVGHAMPSMQPTMLPGFGSMAMAPDLNAFANSTEQIDGEKIGDVAAVVRTKIPFYLRKFTRTGGGKHKLSWNWSALLFGPYWFFFRRMSKIGALFMAVQLTAQIIVQTIFSANLNQFYGLLESTFGKDALSQPTFFSNPENLQRAGELAQQSNFYRYALVSLVVTLIIRMFCCCMANHSYRSHCLSIVKRVRVQIENPEFAERFAASGYAAKTKTDMLRMYLIQLGGTSLFGVLTGYMGYYLATLLISYLT